jgi:hypothetical protein
MEPSIPPPSPLPPTEPGPSLQILDTSTELLDDTDSLNLPKQDLEREILIECSEVYAQSLAKDWEGVAALGMAMDLKVRSVFCAPLWFRVEDRVSILFLRIRSRGNTPLRT